MLTPLLYKQQMILDSSNAHHSFIHSFCGLPFFAPMQTKASSPVTSSTASSNPQKQLVPQEQKEQQQRFLQQNQAQQEQLQRLFQNEDTRPKKQRAYSSPATYLSDKPPPSPMGSKTTSKGEEQENSVLPGGERQSRKGHNKVKSLTLSDVKMPVGPGERLKNLWVTQFMSHNFQLLRLVPTGCGIDWRVKNGS